ncbi:MAG: DUF2671 domain-containing protein [Rickettsiales bacterium]|nr:DUF2671 domain-containing protein [Rickettsiales bacterium]
MSVTNEFLNALKATTKDAQSVATESDSELANLMSDADYLRQSSSLINEALQKGFDVLQLANGDIVTTGTKTVVNQFTWDEEKGKLVKTKTTTERKTKKAKEELLDEDF